MFAIRFLAVTTLVALALRVSSVEAAAPLSPMVDLNTDSASNVLLNVPVSGPTTVKVWYDSANDGSTATQQDFGQNTANSQPAWVPDQPMPNGINRTLIDFTGGTTNGTASTAVDYLTSKIAADARITDVSSTFNRGGDPAYLMDGVSWFSVFRTDNNTGSGTGSSAQIRQAVWSNVYATPNFPSPGGFQDVWATTLQEGPDADDDIVNIRNNSFGDPGIGNPEVVVPNDSPANVDPNTWYIVGNAWDPVAQTFKTKILQANTTTSSTVVLDLSVPSTAPAPNAASGYSNNFVRIGESSNSTSSPNVNREFNGEMAELLQYNRGLSVSEFNTVMTYLENKFFLVVALPGDFNGDHVVNAADYVTWRKNFGAPYTIDDYNAWRANFGATAGAGSGSGAIVAAAVPEPISSVLVMMAFVTIGVSRTVRRRTRT